MNDYIWENENSRLVLSKINGSILAFEVDGNNLLAPAKRAFTLRFLRKNDMEYIIIDDSAFSYLRSENNRIIWSGCDILPGVEFSCKINAAENGAFRFRPSVAGIPQSHFLDFIESPHVDVPMDNDLFYPMCEGVLIDENSKRTRECVHLQFPDDCSLGYYPGICQMQFMASYPQDGGQGIYFAADDLSHTTKILEYSADSEEMVGLRIENSCGIENPSDEFELPFELILRPFFGDWRNACEIYREWVKNDPAMVRNFALPNWLEASPVTVIYPVRGKGKISDEPNAFLPYENAFPCLKKLGDAFDSKIMALLMRWDHNGPWLPPYYWPPVGGVESFRKFRDMLHEAGHLLGVYGSGTAYTMNSKINSYSGAQQYDREGLEKIMTRGPKGERETEICHSIRDGEAFCISEKRSREILAEQVKILAEENVDFTQFFDQNLGAASFICYAKNHTHPPVPGRWQTEAMQKFLDELNMMIRQCGSNMLLGTECAAAGPYLSALPFNDLRDVFTILRGEAVPAYQYVFHAYANNFFGNQCVAWERIDCEASEDNLQFRLAKAFIAGEMLSVVLRDSEEIDWGAAADWSKPAPQQEPVIKLIRTLNSFRRKHPEFLSYGEAVIPPHSLKCGTYTLHYRHRTAEYPSVLTSAWRSDKGDIMQFFVNFRTVSEPVHIDGKAMEIPPLTVLAL